MGAFEYSALDAAGKERKGILEGDTPRHIRQLLREQQLLPVSVTEVAQKEATRQKRFSFARKVSAGDLSLFTRQLATLVEWLSGVQASFPPHDLRRARLVMFAADHGIAEAGVSARPAGSTNIQAADVAAGADPYGGLAHFTSAGLRVVDVGLMEPVRGIDTRVARRGTGRIDRDDGGWIEADALGPGVDVEPVGTEEANQGHAMFARQINRNATERAIVHPLSEHHIPEIDRCP